uniref:Uncharacterized protein n=1 Tax=Physcomitrium patens TaxID=3218 RepID=A0A2K1JCS4_PHYPA|nr:hypothetical protein PHYPA_019605 [Physcomitrium patens]
MKRCAIRVEAVGSKLARGNPNRFQVCRLNHSAKLTRQMPTAFLFPSIFYYSSPNTFTSCIHMLITCGNIL